MMPRRAPSRIPWPKCMSRLSERGCSLGLSGKPNSRSSVRAGTWESGRPLARCSSFSPRVIAAAPTAPAAIPCSAPGQTHPRRFLRLFGSGIHRATRGQRRRLPSLPADCTTHAEDGPAESRGAPAQSGSRDFLRRGAPSVALWSLLINRVLDPPQDDRGVRSTPWRRRPLQTPSKVTRPSRMCRRCSVPGVARPGKIDGAPGDRSAASPLAQRCRPVWSGPHLVSCRAAADTSGDRRRA